MTKIKVPAFAKATVLTLVHVAAGESAVQISVDP
jgi:hypothetical protein